MRKLFIFICLVFISLDSFSQRLDHQLDTIEVIDLRIENDNSQVQKLNKAQITALQPEDVGQLLQRFVGVSLKSYGGLGGMKTISVRGINGNQTGIVVDGFSIQNTQTGQLDLSNIQTESIEKMTLSIGGTQGFLNPISALIGGSCLSIETFESNFGMPAYQVRSAVKVGSFGQTDSFLALKVNKNRSFFSLMGKYREAAGKYDFEIENGNQLYQGKRLNNDFKEGFGGFSSGFRVGKSVFRINDQFNQSDKGLPGAVILYNTISNQRLKNITNQFNVDFTRFDQIFPFRIYASMRNEQLIYVDSTYLNTAGYLDNRYYNTHFVNGFSFRKLSIKRRELDSVYQIIEISSSKKFKLVYFGGIEQSYSLLNSNLPTILAPQRYQLKAVLGTEKNWNRSNLLVQVGEQYFSDKQSISGNIDHRFVFTPYAIFQTEKWRSFIGGLNFWAKRSFRIPTFNELYYNALGNLNLKPEIANQFNIGNFHTFYIHRNQLKFRLDAYYNLVENKIVAIPTKNLFVWSIQNVGKSQVFGADFQFNHSRKFSELKLETNVNYSFQKVEDLSDKNSATYKNQLPYLPQHTLNADFTVVYKSKSGITISGLATSSRYALNENIDANKINGFYVFDASIYHTFSLPNTQSLRLSLNVKNLLNQSYAFVRYYVMPGTNFLISLNYAIH
jgi:vitamin B12 transporter